VTNSPIADHERELEARYQARLDQEVTRLRHDSRRAVEEFKRSFPPPSDEQIEKLLYPELSEFAVELGNRRFVLRELPALVEKRFLRLVEQKLPALVAEVLSFDTQLGEPASDAAAAFTRLLTRAGTALDMVADACALVLDPTGEHGVTREFIQQHASTARQLRILKAQLLLNGTRDFLSPLFPGPKAQNGPEGPLRSNAAASTSTLTDTPGSPPPSVGSNSSAGLRTPSHEISPWDNLP
jgi:hypothetical protein